MPDITKCNNNNCSNADNCWRYCCPSDRDNQMYQTFEPLKENEDNFVCEFFIEFPKD